MHICTTGDSKYLHKGLALYQSLLNKIGPEFTLHWLCIDEKIFQILCIACLPGIKPYSLKTMENDFPELLQVKANPRSKYGDEYSQYCWYLTPWFISHLLNKETFDTLLYADSDIYFYQSPKVIAEVVAAKGAEVGIHTHRFSGAMNDDIDTGWFNVGVMFFTKSWLSISIALFWKNLVGDIKNPFYEKYGTCGDQKYLEVLYKVFKNSICVFDEDPGICHKAPWCTDTCFDRPIVFYHFSHFIYDLKEGTWSDSLKGEWNPCSSDLIKKEHYEPYFLAVKHAAHLIEPAEDHYNQLNQNQVKPSAIPAIQQETTLRLPKIFLDIIGNIKVDAKNPERVKYLLACIRSFSPLKRNVRFLLNLEDASTELIRAVDEELLFAGFNFQLESTRDTSYYSIPYQNLLKKSDSPYVLNFIEDHFFMVEDISAFKYLMATMKYTQSDIMRASFNQVELKAAQNVVPYYQDDYCLVFDNDQSNFNAFQNPWPRYYIGVNFITTRKFAIDFWERNLSRRPHEYEIAQYDDDWFHRCIIPKKEVLCAIDNDHGLPGTNLLQRPDAKRFWTIFNSINF